MITDFLRSTPSADRGKAIRLLEAISEKDRRDVSREVLADALATAETGSPLFDAYIMNPRIETEGLTPFKAFFAKAIPSADKSRFKADPAALVEWIGREIAVDTVWNRTGNRIDPRAAYKNRIADGRSRAILFVAMARSLGIPSRVDPVTGKPQYAVGDSDWIDALFAAPKTSATPKGKLVLEVSPVGHIVDPQYYMQFALSKIENGVPQLLEFDEAAPASQLNADGISLDAGRYMLVTGQRLADGSVMTRTDIFEVRPIRLSPVRLSSGMTTAKCRSSARSTPRISTVMPPRSQRRACCRQQAAVTMCSVSYVPTMSLRPTLSTK